MTEPDRYEPSGNQTAEFVNPHELFTRTNEQLFKGLGAFRVPQGDSSLFYVGDLSETEVNSPLFSSEATTLTLKVDPHFPRYEIETDLKLTDEVKANGGGFYDFKRVLRFHEVLTSRKVQSFVDIFPNNTTLTIYDGKRRVAVEFGVPTLKVLDIEEEECLKNAAEDERTENQIREDYAAIREHGFTGQSVGLKMVRQQTFSGFTGESMGDDLAFYQSVYNTMFQLFHEVHGVPVPDVSIKMRTPESFDEFEEDE